jgi:16S rRNA (cytosine967-C5)-methyltransferase
MQVAAQHAAAIAVLDSWNGGVPVEQALTRWARGARYAGSKDRAAVRDIVYSVLRRKGTCAALGGGEAGRALVLGLLRFNEVEPDTVFSGVGHGPAPLGEVERSGGATPKTRHPDFPDWVVAELDAFAERDAVLDSLLHRAPLWVRVNLRKGTPEAAIDRLAEDGVVAASHPDLAAALTVTEGERRVRNARAYLDGLVEIQDLSAHLAVARLDLPQTGKILDYCAGGGGKALALADRSDAQVFAHDALPKRMADLPARAARAGVQIKQRPTGALDAEGPFDCVLTDVPCSGSGTWRRDPEAKWRLDREGLVDLTRVQADILDRAAEYLAPGGQLVYMTCSLFRAENDDQIAAFLARHAGWTCASRHLVTPLSASDGFFSAVLKREEDSPER